MAPDELASSLNASLAWSSSALYEVHRSVHVSFPGETDAYAPVDQRSLFVQLVEIILAWKRNECTARPRTGLARARYSA